MEFYHRVTKNMGVTTGKIWNSTSNKFLFLLYTTMVSQLVGWRQSKTSVMQSWRWKTRDWNWCLLKTIHCLHRFRKHSRPMNKSKVFYLYIQYLMLQIIGVETEKLWSLETLKFSYEDESAKTYDKTTETKLVGLHILIIFITVQICNFIFNYTHAFRCFDSHKR